MEEAAVLAVAVAALLASRARDRATVAPWLAPAAVLVLYGVISAVWVPADECRFPHQDRVLLPARGRHRLLPPVHPAGQGSSGDHPAHHGHPQRPVRPGTAGPRWGTPRGDGL
ncbi:hypothetical protein QP028_08595 [Corynebacterium suedekumii]|nr:hypothetical protein QP028_08595 [Corynebacterium suedekumii]